ncbi:glutamate receptor U1-like [Palaemon carinicauda]|uniref:glutamate receptor U1-like n=1 Tax=Palaemon carinicauda TaxID=392227 RepID=UPI0035B611C4
MAAAYYIILFWAAFFCTASNGNQQNLDNRRTLVVIYDQWADFSSSSRRQQDIHAKSAFETIASSFGITTEYLRIPYQEVSFHSLWRSKNLAGVISVGECILGDIVLSSGMRSGTPSLAFDNENCQRKLASKSPSLPIYRVKIHRRYQCAVHILYQWLATPRKKSKSKTSLRSPLLPRDLLPSDKENYHQEYLNCVGTDVLLDINEIDPKFPPSDMKLELGKRFLNGRELTIVTINRPPFVKLELSGKEVLGAEGFCYEMLDVMAHRYNFTYKLVLPYDGNWGAKMANGTFNGMVGMVHRHEVDMAIAGFTITYIRETVIDFTHAFYEEPTTILIPPPTEQNDFLAFLSPFSWQVWIGNLVSVIAVGSLMSFMATVGNSPYLYPHNYRSISYSWSRYVWDCAFSLTAQGNQMKQTEPIRVMSALWLTVSMIVIYTYTGNLIAFLTVPKISNLINSLEELANQREVLWTYRAKTAHDELFSTAPAPGTYHKIGQLLLESPDLFVKSDNEGVAAVLRGKMAFIKEKSWLDFAMEEDFLKTKKCRLSQVNQLFFSAGFGWVLQEESIYLPLVNEEILRMMQSGLFTIWRQKYWPKPNKCTAGRSTATGPRALHLGNFLGHFFLLGVGVSLALSVLIVEKIMYRPKQQEDQVIFLKK